MIRFMLRAAGLATGRDAAGDQAAMLTPDEQLRRFAEVCEGLSASEDGAEDRDDEE